MEPRLEGLEADLERDIESGTSAEECDICGYHVDGEYAVRLIMQTLRERGLIPDE